MKKLLCLAVIALCSVIGCAPAENGSPAPSDNTTSQIEAPATNLNLIENA